MPVEIGLLPYRLPLRQPWRSAHGRLDTRDGWLVTVSDGLSVGYGDCAPLPEAGTELPAQAAQRLRFWQARAESLSDEQLLDALGAVEVCITPAADAAVESALLDLCAKRAGLTLAGLLNPSSRHRRVAVNAALGALEDDSAEALRRHAQDGFRVFKFKVGSAAPGDELARFATLLQALPATGQLRLDANGAWEAPAAQTYLQALERILAEQGRDIGVIESLEEPLKHPSDDALARLQAQTRIPLALDESLHRGRSVIRPDRLPVRRIVLKPGAVGGLRRSLALAKAALASGIEPVVTSLIESAAGLWTTAQLAAAIDGLRPRPDALQPCHGIATADWLLADLGAPPRPLAGWIPLPQQPGSGFIPSDPPGSR